MATMKAAIATGFGAIDQNVFVRKDFPKPSLPAPVQNDSSSNNHLLIRVLSCALAPGDVRLLSGNTDYVQLPKSGHPYVIGSDVCGIVVEQVPACSNNKFKVGDRVVSRFDEPKPVGGLGEYRVVQAHLTEHAPKTLTPVQACTLPASAMAAKVVAQSFVRKNDRVLVLGGSGGVGTFLCQYVKLQEPSFLAATSTNTELVLELGADQVIDYRTQNWWEVEDFQKNPFDVVIDLVNGDNWQRGACSGLAVKHKGKYVQLLSGVATEMRAHGPLDVIRLVFGLGGRALFSRLHPRVPTWYAPEALALREGDLAELFRDVDEGRIHVTLDPASPFPFTEEGVRNALELQKSIRARGKVVVQMAEQ